jgi:hypothetical protein
MTSGDREGVLTSLKVGGSKRMPLSSPSTYGSLGTDRVGVRSFGSAVSDFNR